MKDMTHVPMAELVRLCHEAEDTNDDLLLNDVMGELDRRDAASVWTSPTTGVAYPTGNPSNLFHSLYMAQMADRSAARRGKSK